MTLQQVEELAQKVSNGYTDSVKRNGQLTLEDLYHSAKIEATLNDVPTEHKMYFISWYMQNMVDNYALAKACGF